MDIDRQVAELLAPLRDAEPGTRTTVSVQRAVAEGSRRRRFRQWFGSGAVALCTAVAAAVVPAVVTTTGAAPTEFDVVRQAFRVGSAGGYTPVSYETGRYRQRVELGAEPHSTLPPGRATVTLYARGRLTPDPRWAEAPDVHGRPARWSPSGTEIAWEWDRDAWATARVTEVGEEARVRVHRVALSVEKADTEVKVPFTVQTAERLAGVITPHGSNSEQAAAALLVFGEDDGRDRAVVGVQQNLGRDPVTGLPIDRLNGTAPNGGTVVLRDHGVRLFGYTVVSTDGPRAAAVAGSVRFVGDPVDARNWVREPLR